MRHLIAIAVMPFVGLYLTSAVALMVVVSAVVFLGRLAAWPVVSIYGAALGVADGWLDAWKMDQETTEG